jgi:hypothetical protein
VTAIQVYNETVHWNAVHNGEMKFIFHAFWSEGDARQFQLFNLTADPYELQDLARSPEPRHAAELGKWKGVMARQFLEEGRDKWGFVTPGGKLLGAAHRNLTGESPNYPTFTPPDTRACNMSAWADCCGAAGAAALAAGDALRLGGSSPRSCQQVSWSKADGSLALVSSGRALCIAPNSTAASGGDVGLSLARCPGTPGGVAAAVTAFHLEHGRGQVVHTGSKKCLRGGAGQPPVLGACDAAARVQQWVLGASGRLCGVGGCLSALPYGP